MAPSTSKVGRGGAQPSFGGPSSGAPDVGARRVEARGHASATDGPEGQRTPPLGSGGEAGQVFALIVMVIAACEVVIGLGIIVAMYRNRLPIDIDEMSELRG